MNVYNKERACVKCGEVGVSANYSARFDNIIRTCVACGYSWRELPLDADTGDIGVMIVPGSLKIEYRTKDASAVKWVNEFVEGGESITKRKLDALGFHDAKVSLVFTCDSRLSIIASFPNGNAKIGLFDGDDISLPQIKTMSQLETLIKLLADDEHMPEVLR